VKSVVVVLALVFAVGAVGCGGAQKSPKTGKTYPPGVQEGKASWYGGSHHGGPTASGERFNKNAMTAAHRTLKMNTRVRVTNKRNGRSVEVRINDRGPYGRGRIIDLSEAAAKKLDMIDDGVVPVRIEVVK
jgi:rare lipoprotein A